MFRPITLLLFVVLSIAVAEGQPKTANKADSNKTAKAEKLQDIPFTGGVNLQFLLTELARDIDLNLLFDPASRLEARNVRIELRNVTHFDAINAILLQEGLTYEQAGPRTILISRQLRGNSLPQIGVGLTQLTPQLNEYFGAKNGVLINTVVPDSTGAAAGLKAGDVITEIDGTPIAGPLALFRAIAPKTGSEVTLKVIRNRKPKSIKVTAAQGIK